MVNQRVIAYLNVDIAVEGNFSNAAKLFQKDLKLFQIKLF